VNAREHALAVLEWGAVLEAVADRCSSAAGSRLARSLLPDLSREEALRSLRETDEARRLLGEEALPTGGVRDVAAMVDAAGRGGALGGAELLDVAWTLDAVGRLKRFLDGHADEAPLLAERAVALVDLSEIVAATTARIDERGEVRDDATPELRDLRRRRAVAAQRIEQVLARLRHDPDVAGALSDDFVTVRESRFVLPVRTDRRGAVPGILHGRSSSGHSLFVEPAAVVELNNDLRSIEIEIEEEVHRILRELSGMVGSQSAAILGALGEHARIDLAAAKARLAETIDASTPELVEDGTLSLPALAHPLLLLLRAQEGQPLSSVVRNDVVVRPPAVGIVISGPNTGGKTVLLKATGLAVLMARAGIPIATFPGARVPLLQGVYADIGDEQSLERSLSSFSGHVANLLSILDACEADSGASLVLLDEIMAGTDPVEGTALARALLEHLASRGVLTIVTTHLGDLKAFAAEDGRFVNAGMELDPPTLRPTYRLRLGVPGASAALFVAERLGVPVPVVERARALAGGEAVRAEALLHDLDAARAEALRLRGEAAELRAEAEAARVLYERRLDEVRTRDAAFASKERRRFERELAELRAQAARITRDLQQAPSLPRAAEAIRGLEDIKERARAAEASPSVPVAEPPRTSPAADRPLRRGDRVRSIALGRAGVVEEEADARGRLRVAFGPISVQLASSDVALEHEVAATRPARQAAGHGARAASAPAGVEGTDRGGIPFTPRGPANTCDLRGRRVDEALGEFSRFLEGCRAAGERRAVIIHGHGTGALKAAVRRELPGEARVEAWRPGVEGEGGDGVTIVTLA
jgi:DNA mismatch repair protein MutS2